MRARPERRRALARLAVTVAFLWGLAGPAWAQVVPPPTPVPPDGSPSPFPTAIETPENAVPPPDIDAPAAVLEDMESGQILFGKDVDERRAIASLTKLMTALITVQRAPQGDVVTVSARADADAFPPLAAVLGLEQGERISARQLLYALLLSSSNDAAVALAEHVAGTVERFVSRMNWRARRLGLDGTRFASPNGLDEAGYSTARDVAAVARDAFSDPVIDHIGTAKFHRIPSPDGGVRRIQNRNVLLWLYPDAGPGKTGYTSLAGYCLAASASREGRSLVAVVLGAESSGEAASEAATLLEHGFEGFEERTLARPGQRFEPLRIGGELIPTQAEDTFVRLVAEEATVTHHLVAGPELRPGDDLDPGDRVGHAVFTADGARLGVVPLFYAGRPGSPAPFDGWGSAFVDVGELLIRAFAAVFGG